MIQVNQEQMITLLRQVKFDHNTRRESARQWRSTRSEFKPSYDVTPAEQWMNGIAIGTKKDGMKGFLLTRKPTVNTADNLKQVMFYLSHAEMTVSVSCIMDAVHYCRVVNTSN